jgi:hypothetical protein
MARTYKRDSRGRFAGGGGSSGGSRPKPKAMQRGANRLTRNNAGRITSVGGAGATARGGRLRTAAGKKRATVTTKISGGRSGVVGKPKGLKPGAVKVKAAPSTNGKGRAPLSKLGGKNSDAYKYNKMGQVASPSEREKIYARDRRREKNAALAVQQSAGRRRAERRAARNVESGRITPQEFSTTASFAKSAYDRRVKRASQNFGPGGVELMRRERALTVKAKSIEAKAAARKSEGKPITKHMQKQHAELRRQIIKAQRSQATRKKALDVYGVTKARMESNIRSRSRYAYR